MITKTSEAIYGLLVGDALGVPWEFAFENDCVDNKHLINMITPQAERGFHKQPSGSFSDDGSMTLATIAVLNEMCKPGAPVKLSDFYMALVSIFKNWIDDNPNYSYLNSNEVLFDYGTTTLFKIEELSEIDEGFFEYRIAKIHLSDQMSGNGALMRILPLAFWKDATPEIIRTVASLTHPSKISNIVCEYYIYLVRELLKGNNFEESLATVNKMIVHGNDFAYVKLIHDAIDCCLSNGDVNNYSKVPVLTTFMIAIRCVLTSDSYRDAVTQAVMYGGDTDTNAAVTGGLAACIMEVPTDMVSELRIHPEARKLIYNFEKLFGNDC